jgi:hypothetical protein
MIWRLPGQNLLPNASCISEALIEPSAKRGNGSPKNEIATKAINFKRALVPIAFKFELLLMSLAYLIWRRYSGIDIKQNGLQLM